MSQEADTFLWFWSLHIVFIAYFNSKTPFLVLLLDYN